MGYKQAKEGGEALIPLIRCGGSYKVKPYLSLGLAVGLQPLGPSPVRRSSGRCVVWGQSLRCPSERKEPLSLGVSILLL
jgi:hypothetical protein